jgi:hypothetical protein
LEKMRLRRFFRDPMSFPAAKGVTFAACLAGVDCSDAHRML